MGVGGKTVWIFANTASLIHHQHFPVQIYRTLRAHEQALPTIFAVASDKFIEAVAKTSSHPNFFTINGSSKVFRVLRGILRGRHKFARIPGEKSLLIASGSDGIPVV